MAELDLNGYTELPPGKIANVVTLLELSALPPRRSGQRADLSLMRMENISLDRYRTLFRRIGEDWMWFSRLVMPDNELKVLLADSRTLIWVVLQDDNEVGLIELDLRQMPSIELSFFGLVPEATGSGIGGWMMDQALERAFSHGPERVWVHTCTLDHPAALAFYMRCGFKPYRRAVEVADDPRLSGVLPRSATPQLPIL